MKAVSATEMARARRAIASARALFREGLVPECHAYMSAALRALLSAWAPNAEGEAAPLPDSAEQQDLALAALERAFYPKPERLRAALMATVHVAPEASVLPPARSPDCDWIWAEVERLHRFTARHFMPAAARKRARLRLAVSVAVVCLISALFGLRLWGRPHARASAVWSEEHAADNALDGIDGTEWLLPEATTGWLDVMFHSPRSLHSVRLINAHNVYFADRGAKRVRVTAFSDQGPIASADGEFAMFTRERSALDLSLEAKRVTRLRVEVLSFFLRGGGLAEVQPR